MHKDCHVHTNISHDGVSKIEDYLSIANSKNVNEITFTEHYDVYDGINSNLNTLDVENYFTKFNQIKENNDFKINFGIEIGLQPDIIDNVKNVVEKYPFDFIIGSSHITCKKDMAMDKTFFEGYTRYEAYLRYFKEVLENIKIYNEFDVYGHLDYVVRYGGYLEKKINYNEFNEILDNILEELIKKDKGIEINTSGIRYKLGNPHPNIDIIKRYIMLGGKIITIGSDSHKTDNLAQDFNLVYDMLDYLNIKEVAVFRNRKPDFIKIKELRK